MKPKKNIKISKDQLLAYVHTARKYAALAFLLFLVAIYGFLGWRIVSLTGEEPNQADVSTQLKTVGVPKVNQDVVDKMQKLDDNSVSVHTLFDQARQNPFSE